MLILEPRGRQVNSRSSDRGVKNVYILLGPTGVGKTALSLLLARTLNTEIISADSMQIYRHMDIGTAKPSKEERQAVRHHMIDIVDPWESFSTGEYVTRVVPVIEGLHNQGKIPLVVGGTGLYIRAMTRGIFSGPSADWDLRNELLGKEEADKGSLYEDLTALDPLAASRIMRADTRRVVRALEVCLKSEQKMSDLHRLLTRSLPYEFLKAGITRDRKELYRMIEQRVDRMMAEGLLDEVRGIVSLIGQHGNSLPLESFPAMQAIGYKELVVHLAGNATLDEAVRLVKKRSKLYAKRQFTWFRREPDITWVDVTGLRDPNEIFEKVSQVFHG